MATSLDKIQEFLKALEVKHPAPSVDNDGDALIFVPYGIEDAEIGNFDLQMIISLTERNRTGGYEFMQILAKGFNPEGRWVADKSEYYGVFLKYLLKQSYRFKIGKWAHDPDDGDSYLVQPISIEDGELTQMQFKRIYATLLSTAKDAYVELERIFRNGNPEQAITKRSVSEIQVELLKVISDAGKLDLVPAALAFKGSSEQLDAVLTAAKDGNWASVKALLG